MLRLIAFSDIHIDAVTAGRPRKTEVLQFIERVFHLAHKHKANVIVFAGDAHDPGRALDALYSAELIRHVFAFVRAELAPTFVAVAGNHDVVDSSELFLQDPVTTLTPLRAAAAFANGEQRLFVFDRPGLQRVAEGWSVLGLPYVSRVHADQQVVWDAHAFDCARRCTDKLIVVAHRVVVGAQMTSESTEMARGQDQLFPVELVQSLKPALVINGHYHARQTVRTPSGLRIDIPGAPLRFTFGDVQEVGKGVLYAELE